MFSSVSSLIAVQSYCLEFLKLIGLTSVSVKMFIFGCTGSLLLCGLFASWVERGLLSSCGALTSPCDGVSCCRACALGHAGFSSCSMCPQQLWLRGLAAPWHVGSSWIRDRTCVSCFGRQILYPRATREACSSLFLSLATCLPNKLILIDPGSLSCFPRVSWITCPLAALAFVTLFCPFCVPDSVKHYLPSAEFTCLPPYLCWWCVP